MLVIPTKVFLEKSALCVPARHCEERSDEAIQGPGATHMPWAGLLRLRLAMTGWESDFFKSFVAGMTTTIGPCLANAGVGACGEGASGRRALESVH